MVSTDRNRTYHSQKHLLYVDNQTLRLVSQQKAHSLLSRRVFQFPKHSLKLYFDLNSDTAIAIITMATRAPRKMLNIILPSFKLRLGVAPSALKVAVESIMISAPH